MLFLKALAMGVLCYAAIIVWMYFSQQGMLYMPRRDLATTPADVGLDYEDVILTSSDGKHIHGWWVPHESARFTVLFCHGNGGNISHRLETFRIFHDLGLSTFMFDYQGYGQSEGVPSEQATRADARASWDWLVREKGLLPERILIFGRSLGGAVGSHLTGELVQEGAEPAGLVVESSFTSVPDMGAYMYPWLPVRQLAKYSYDSVSALKGVRIPVLFAHSRDDDIVPFAIGAALYESHGGPKSFLELQGDHNFGYLHMGDTYPEGLHRFLLQIEAGR